MLRPEVAPCCDKICYKNSTSRNEICSRKRDGNRKHSAWIFKELEHIKAGLGVRPQKDHFIIFSDSEAACDLDQQHEKPISTQH